MKNKKALLIRIDRIGDLILTLPADQQPTLKDYQCHWFISKGLGFIPDHADPKRSFHEWQKQFSFKQFFEFIKAIRKINPDVSVSFHSPWWVPLALFIARVPKRIGVLSKWHSYLFLNKGIRQKRSKCEHHELEYNHLLVHQGLEDSTQIQFPHLKLKAKPVDLEFPKKFVVVHPGMAGSALNWPLEYYEDLINRLTKNSDIIVTGTATDQTILKPLKKKLFANTRIHWWDEKLSGQQLIATLSKAQAVFAPSTGVIHIAASLGVPTYGIYSPVKVQRAERWGPKGDQTEFFAPNVDCPGHFKCLGSVCTHYNCMELVTAPEIYKNVSRKLD